MAAKYGTQSLAHEYGTPPSVWSGIHAPGISFHTLQPWKTLIPLRVPKLMLNNILIKQTAGKNRFDLFKRIAEACCWGVTPQ